MKKPEILSPAGNMEKLQFAFQYGADAVYAAGRSFGLRESAGNFSDEELASAVSLAHSLGKKIYITANIFPYNSDIKPMEEYFSFLNTIKPDGIIISDLGAFSVAKIMAPNIPIHISVQANNLNYAAVKTWQQMGASRIVLAREISFEDIKEIREKCPDMELEIFVHGAICVSYSGRCLISQYLSGRDANHGECTQGCRWKYRLEEEQRPGEYFDVEEDNKGTYLYNSKDLCAFFDLHKFIEIGIDSFKIEGRMKSPHYVAVTAGVYNKAVEQYMKNPKTYIPDQALYEELSKVSHREFTDAFYFPDKVITQNVKSSAYITGSKYAGHIKEKGNKISENIYSIAVEVKKTMNVGDIIQILTPSWKQFDVKIVGIQSLNGAKHTYTKQYGELIMELESKEELEKLSILRINT
ncbi:MAG: U32 family peptidase [bacterium]